MPVREKGKKDDRERERREADAINHLAELEAIYTWAPVGLCVFDRELRWRRLNQRIAEINGVPIEDHLGKTPRDIVPDVADQAEAALRRILDTGEPLLDFEMTGTTAAQPGVVRSWNERWMPIKDEQQRVIGISVVAEETTELKRAEAAREAALHDNERLYAEAQQANRMKDDFIAMLSHELRTPLNAVLGWTAILKKGIDDRRQRERVVEIIERNARIQAQLLNDVLDIARIGRGKVTLEETDVDLTALVTEVADMMRPSAREKGVALEVRIAPDVIVHADATRLEQVVWNLLQNALKFTPEGGRIDVRAERTDGSVEITVSDTGVGISEEFLPFVFDRFRQGDDARQKLGIGLGLTIVKRLVELHGGAVSAASAGPGQGAAFTVRLPVVEKCAAG